MTAANRLTSKGQVTIPVHVRRELGLQPGDAVEFSADRGVVVMRRAIHSSDDKMRAFEAVLGSADRNVDLSTDELLDLIRPQRLDPDA